MKVKLISMTPKPIDVMWTAARTCYSAKSPIEMWDDRYGATSDDCEHTKEWIEQCIDKHWNLVKKVLDSGHQSVAEHVYFTFAIEGISRACYDDQTEVLTKKGWKFLKHVSIDDEFATINGAGSVEFQKATDFISYNYNGKMHRYASQNVDLCVTPNHKLYIKKYDVRTSNNFELAPSEKINVKRFYMTKEFNYQLTVSPNITINGYTYTKNYKNNNSGLVKTENLELPKSVLFPLMAWYLSDGSTYYNEKENSYSVSISQTKCSQNLLNGTRERIKELIRNLGFTATEDKNTIKFKNLTMGKFLKELGHCDEKYIPWDIYGEFDQPLAKLFINEYFKGDGHIDKNGCGKLYTSSKKLAEQLYQLCFIAGYTCKIHEVAPRGSHYIGEQLVQSIRPSYVINVTLTKNGRNKNIVIKKDKHFSEVDYSGTVYCVTVPNHTLFVRRNGIAVWCGNCSHQLVRHRAGIVFSQQSQRYVEIKESKQELMEILNRYEGPEMKALCDKYFVEFKDMISSDLIKTLCEYRDLVDGGCKAEDARNVLPNATKTNITMSINLRELMHTSNLRLCSRSQLEIRQLFQAIKKEVESVEPRLAALLVPTCEVHGMCFEDKCCGRKPRVNEVKGAYKLLEGDDTILSGADWEQLMESINNPKVNDKLAKFMKEKIDLEIDKEDK